MGREEARHALSFLWGRLARPLDPVAAVGALVGLPRSVTRQFLGATLATAPEVDALLDAMPILLRSLSVATVTKTERCVGQIRGPILWNETMSARSASAGDPGLFVCSANRRAYDTDENRVLVGALGAISRAGLDVERVSARNYDDDVFRRARVNAARAERYLEHRSLAELDPRRPSRRNIHRTRAGSRRKVYAPALAVIARVEEPVVVDHLLEFCDERTTAQHDLVAAVVRRLEQLGYHVPTFHAQGGQIDAGPLRYRHTQLRGDGSGVDGVQVGRVLIDVPEDLRIRDRERAQEALDARTPPGVESYVIFSRGDINRAVERAMALGLS